MTLGSAARYERVLAAFIRFATAHNIHDLSEARGALVLRFVHAPRRGGGAPASATSRFRLTVVRDAFCSPSLAGSDPTTGLRVEQPPQTRISLPLTPTEAFRLRAAGRLAPRDHLRPAAIELALVGGAHAEIASCCVADLDLANARVRLGSRWSDLDPFALSTLRSRTAACKGFARRSGTAWDPIGTPLALTRPLAAYPATSIAPSISSSLSRAMTAAGITRDGLRPASIREYAANRVYAITGRVEDVAELLGLRSLDHAMGFVDDEWQDHFGPEVRA